MNRDNQQEYHRVVQYRSNWGFNKMTREIQEKTIKYIADEGKLLSNSMVAEGSESNRMFFKVAYVPLNSSSVFVEFT